MEIKDIHYDQFREKTDKKARLRRVQRGDRVRKVRDIKDLEKDKEEEKSEGQETSAPVVIQAKEQNSSTTIELTEKASPIANINVAKQYIEGQHIGNISKLRDSLINGDEKATIKKVKNKDRQIQQASQAYEKSTRYNKETESEYEQEI